MAKAELLMSGGLKDAVKWLNENTDMPPPSVQRALEEFIGASTDDMVAKGAGQWACSFTIGKNRKFMHDSNEEHPVLVIHYIAWPPIEAIEAHFNIDLQGKEPTPEHLHWIQENALQYVCGLIVEEGNDRKVVEFMKTFKKEDLNEAARATQEVIDKLTNKGE